MCGGGGVCVCVPVWARLPNFVLLDGIGYPVLSFSQYCLVILLLFLEPWYLYY